MRWYGFNPIFQDSKLPAPNQTQIFLHAENRNGAYQGLISWIFRQDKENIIFKIQGAETAPWYHVVLGKGHNPCLPYLETLNGSMNEKYLGDEIPTFVRSIERSTIK